MSSQIRWGRSAPYKKGGNDMKAKIAGTCVLGAIAFAAFVSAAQAQIFPTRSIPVIAPWSAHDATDMQLDPILVSDSDKERSADFDEHDRTLGTLIFRDEFQRFHIWDGRDGWNVTGGPQWGGPQPIAPPSFVHRVVPQGTEPFNNDLGWYLDPSFQPATVNPFSADDGVLSIKATPVPAPKNDFSSFPYTTGMINSYQSFKQLYGYFEMRAKLPRGAGFLPAFWLLPADGSHGEIDAMEVLGSDPTQLYTTVHSFSPGPNDTGKTTTIPDASKGFHTYGVDWQLDYITWYFDGEQVFQAKTPSDLHTPMYMIANLAVAGPLGSWPAVGVPAPGSAAEMKIDYIRVYSTVRLT
jgi:Glycosyl hydrolases family 16